MFPLHKHYMVKLHIVLEGRISMHFSMIHSKTSKLKRMRY